MSRPSNHLSLVVGALALATAMWATVALSSDEPQTNLLAVPFEAGGLKGWSLIALGGAVGQVTEEAAVRKDDTNSHSLRLMVVNPGQRCGVSNHGVAGINVKAGLWYDLAFQARTEKRDNDRGYALTVSLESEDGRQVFARTTLPEVGGDWKNYTVALNARVSDTKTRLVITLSEPGTIWFDDVSLRARLVDDRPKK